MPTDFLFHFLKISNISSIFLWIIFIISAIIVILTTMVAPRLILALFRRSTIGKMFISIVLVSMITSAPEFLSIVVGPLLGDTTVNDATGVAKSIHNIFGANLIGGVMLILLQMFFFRAGMQRKKFITLRWTTLFVILFDFAYLFLMIFPKFFNNRWINWPFFNLFTIILVGIYISWTVWLIFLPKLKKGEISVFRSKFIKTDRSFSFSFYPVLILALILTIILLIFSMIIVLTIAHTAAKNLGVETTIIGGLLLGITTAFPEIWSAIVFFSLGMFTFGIGVFIGSQLFNMVLLTILVSRHSDILAEVSFTTDFQMHLIFVLLATIVANILIWIYLWKFPKSKKTFFWLIPILMVLNFIFIWLIIS